MQCKTMFWCQNLCSSTCKVFRCQQKSHLCPCTLSLLVSTCNMATRLIPPSLLSTPLHSFTLYTPVWRLPPSSNCLDSFINILIRFACIKVATFLVGSKHSFNPLNSRYVLTDSSTELRQIQMCVCVCVGFVMCVFCNVCVCGFCNVCFVLVL